MAFDGIMVRALSAELSVRLRDARVTRIQQTEASELLMTFRTLSGTERLLLSANASLPLVYLTGDTKPAPDRAPAFSMLLRKHLTGARFSGVTQPGTERILRISFEHPDEYGDLCTHYLIVELMGKHSNIIFTDDTLRILDSIRRVPGTMSSVRTVLPGDRYVIPEVQEKKEPLDETREGFLRDLLPTDRLTEAVSNRYTGFSKSAASEMLFGTGLSEDRYVSSLTPDEKERFADVFTAYLCALREDRYAPSLALNAHGEPQAFSAMPLPSFEASPEFTVLSFTSVSELLERYYRDKNLMTGMKKRSQELRKTVETLLERALRKQDLQTRQLQDTEKRERVRHLGELLQAYSYELPVGLEKVSVTDWETGETVEIPTDPDLSIRDNANRYFDRYGKLKRTNQALTEQLIATQEEVSEYRSLLNSLSIAENEDDLSEIRREMQEQGILKAQAEKKGKKTANARSVPYHYRSSDGFDIYVGKNNFQNDELSFKLAEPKDVWMHAKNAPGSHVIIRAGNREVPDRTYEEAAALAAYYSSLRDSDKAEVDYTFKKELRRTPGGKPGFVIYHTNYSMVAVPDIRGIERIL